MNVNVDFQMLDFVSLIGRLGGIYKLSISLQGKPPMLFNEVLNFYQFKQLSVVSSNEAFLSHEGQESDILVNIINSLERINLKQYVFPV